MSIAVNFVQIPVRVKDSSGKLVSGLTSNDFKVYEDGVVQQLKFFTADAFPLSAAVVVATDLPSTTMKKVNETLPALVGAFSEIDEVALYRYGHTVQQVSGFAGASSVSTATVNRIKRPGRQGGPPMTGRTFWRRAKHQRSSGDRSKRQWRQGGRRADSRRANSTC